MNKMILDVPKALAFPFDDRDRFSGNIHSNYRNEDDAVLFLRDLADSVVSGWLTPMTAHDFYRLNILAAETLGTVMKHFQDKGLDPRELKRFHFDKAWLPYGVETDVFDGKQSLVDIEVESIPDTSDDIRGGTIVFEVRYHTYPASEEGPTYENIAGYPHFLAPEAVLDRDALREIEEKLNRYIDRFEFVEKESFGFERLAWESEAMTEVVRALEADEIDRSLATMKWGWLG